MASCHYFFPEPGNYSELGAPKYAPSSPLTKQLIVAAYPSRSMEFTTPARWFIYLSKVIS